MSTKKTTNRPVFAASKSASESDNKALGARFAAFAALNDAGVTVDSIKGNGADYADFKEGILIGWQGAAFAKKFLSTSDGKAILTGRKIVGQNAFEPVTKAKEDWARDVSGRVGKFRGYYAEWVAPVVAADPAAPVVAADPAAPVVAADPAAPTDAAPDAVTDPAAPAAAPAAKRKSGTKKSLKERIVHDTGAMAAAIVTNIASDRRATDVDHETILVAFNRVLELCGEAPVKLKA